MIAPLGERVLVEPDSPEKMTKGGILLPDTALEKSRTGVVIRKGELADVPVCEGERVIYSAYAGTEVKDNEKTFLVLEVGDLVAVVYPE